LLIDFDGRAVAYPFGELDEVTPAFATTVHISQGSEYPAVVIPILTQHYTMLQRNLLYTGIPRQAPGRACRPEECGRHGRAQQSRSPPLVEIAGAAAADNYDKTNARLAVLVEEAAAGLEVPVIAHR
jgi:hypothetical protein